MQWLSLESINLRNHSTFSDKLSSEAKASELSAMSKMPALGFSNLLADWTFLNFLQYFGDDGARSIKGYELAPAFFEPIITHDPHYRTFYLFLSGSSSIYATTPQASVKLMNEGLAGLSPNEPPDGYYIWRYKGVDELLFLGDSQAAQNSFETAASWAEKSSDPASDMFEQLSRQTAQHLAANPQSKTAQINAWSSVLTTAIDDATRKRAVEQIRALGGDVVFFEDGSIQIKFAQKDIQDSGS
jgi:hypothetical protein